MSVMVGVVIDNNDPESLGRVRVNVPALGESVQLNWAPVLAFMAGNRHGALFLPQAGDQVLVAFEGDGHESPFVIGSFYTGSNRPPVEDLEQQKQLREIRTPGGALIQIDDAESQESIRISDKNGNTLRILTSENEISIQSQGSISISAIDAIELSSGVISLKAEGDLSIEAGGNLSAKAPSMSFDSPEIELGE